MAATLLAVIASAAPGYAGAVGASGAYSATSDLAGLRVEADRLAAHVTDIAQATLRQAHPAFTAGALDEASTTTRPDATLASTERRIDPGSVTRVTRRARGPPEA